MRRRTLLRRAGALATVGTLAIAGCQGPTNSPGAGDDNSPTSQPSPTPPWEAPVTDVRLQTRGGTCKSDDELGADVGFDEADSAVRVHGQIAAPTPCHQVRLESAVVDEGTDEGVDGALRVVLGTAPGDQAGCVQCVGALGFEATVEIEGQLPDTVVVEGPDGELARADRSEATGTPSDDISVRHSSFSVVERSGASGEPTADVTFSDAENQVTVAGTIVGSDGCKTATLSDVSHDPAADLATVSVATTNRPGTEDQFCTQALVTIGYEATVTFDGGTPGEVAVVHDGEEITRAGHGSARAGPRTTTATGTRTDADADGQ